MTRASAAVPNAELAIRRYGTLGRHWVDGINVADPIADAVVADFAGLPPGRGMATFRAAMERGIHDVPDAPDSLRALFAEVDHEPEWLERDRLDRAAGHVVRHVASYGIVFAAASLTSGAMNATGLPLVMTGRYTSQATVRSIEVGAWLEAILKPGGLRRDGAGFSTTLRVRMIHAFVRRHLLTSGEWDSGSWGAPIPQSFMAFTIAEFGHIAVAAMHKLGVRYTADELDDIYHFWRYVGFLNGVGPQLNMTDAADHTRIEELYALTATDPDDGDRDFVRALTHDYLAVEIAALLPLGGTRRHGYAVAVVNGLTRAFLGDEAATKLGVPDTALKHLPRVLSPVIGGTNRILAAVPGISALRTRRALANHGRVMAEQRARYGVRHEMVDDAPDGHGHPAAAVH
jgi:ER-bound oxygenase mpaB/B'/Rubber oxygenase, catalytic domain